MPIRYSNSYELTQYYRSVLSELSPVARREMLKTLERPTYYGGNQQQPGKLKEKQSAKLKGKQPAKPKEKQSAKLQKTGEDDVSKLVRSLRQEPLAYFGRVKKVDVLTKSELRLLEEMLSTRKTEEQYENGELDSNNFV